MYFCVFIENWESLISLYERSLCIASGLKMTHIDPVGKPIYQIINFFQMNSVFLITYLYVMEDRKYRDKT